MSDHSEVLYDPSLHTHASCLRDVQGADLIILLIGSRFGGVAVPQAIGSLDIDAATKASSYAHSLSEKDKISITQAEAIQAVVLERPIFTFVDSRVYADHHLYLANKSNPTISGIKFPSITKQETAKSIFEFISYLSHRSFNNGVTTFQSFSDIEDHLLKQWSLLFQRLLLEKRDKSVDVKKTADIVERIDQLQSAVLQAMPQGRERDLARAVVKFRRVADFLNKILPVLDESESVNLDGTFGEFLSSIGVIDVVWDESLESPYLGLLLLNDGGFLASTTLSDDAINELAEPWTEFARLSSELKTAVRETAAEVSSDNRPFQRFAESLENYHRNLESSGSNVGRALSARRRRRIP